jgi:hypothetical protein
VIPFLKKKKSYETGDRLGCQAAHTKVETIKKLAVKLS